MKFLEEILRKYWSHYEIDEFPNNDSRMMVLEDKEVFGMSTENIRFLINELVRFIGKGVYLEVGMLYGCSLLSAALFNPGVRCIGIDNFSQWGGNEEILQKNLLKFGNPKNIEYYIMDYREGISYIFSKEPQLKVDIYYYDGDHSYANQIEGLDVIHPHLKSKCIILVDDIDWKFVSDANRVWLKKHPDFSSFKISSMKNLDEKLTEKDIPHRERPWWNGFEVITRGFE